LADEGGPSVPGGEWARLPGGREMGPPASVHVDIDGESIWAFIRCDETSPLPFARGGRFGVDCMNNDGTLKPHDTIYKFDSKGNVVKSFGAQMFIWPHGLHVDREGNIWATDSASDAAVQRAAKAGVRAGHIVRKFSPDGKVLMTLGEPGVAGNDERHFNAPAAVVTAENGDIFVADGHGPNDRIVKFSKDGKFIKSWGKTGYAPGEFRVAHCIAMDKRGRLFVCDRSNARIQIFDQDGKHLARWHQFGMPSGIAFSVNDEDLIYVFDSESDNVDNPGFEQGIRIGDALNGWVRYFILDQGGRPASRTGSGPEFGAVDKFGNIFAGEPRPRVLRKYVKVR
jgi:DNA-binding beta-propeller fold protein YncE